MNDHDLAAKLLQAYFTATAALIALMLVSCSGTRPDPLEGAMRADSAIVQAAALDFLENGNCFEGTGKSGIVVLDATIPRHSKKPSAGLEWPPEPSLTRSSAAPTNR